MLLCMLHRKFFHWTHFFDSIIHWKPVRESLWENVQKIWEPIPVVVITYKLVFSYLLLELPSAVPLSSMVCLPCLHSIVCEWRKEKVTPKFQGYFLWDLWLFSLPLNSAVLTGMVGCLTYCYPFFFCFFFFPLFLYPQQTESAYACSQCLLAWFMHSLCNKTIN